MSPVGEKASGFWRVMLSCILLLMVFVCFSFIRSFFNIDHPIPTAFPSTVTITPFTTNTAMVGSPTQTVSIVISTANDHQFDKLKMEDVVIRVSDSAEVDSGADNQLQVHCTSGQSVFGWAPGYEITSVPCQEGQTAYSMTLIHLNAIDNANYVWLSAVNNCNNCHGNRFDPTAPALRSYDEMNEWLKSGHAKIFNGAYFESMYRGTSVTGRPSIPAQPVIIGNEWVPVPPEKSLAYHGPGFQLDFPGQPGNCVYCHVPASIPSSRQSVDLTNLFPSPAGVAGEGVTCDVCHKVFDVILADNRFPFPDRPGILSFRTLRPDSGVFMTGPFSNILTAGIPAPSNHHLTCAPVLSSSEFCAACHFGKFGDMVIYNSYGEWRASRYAVNPEDQNYRTCQDCHMSHLTAEDNKNSLSKQRQACSANNTAFQNFDHNMMDYGPPGNVKQIPLLVKNAADIGINFDTQPTGTNTLDVRVTVTNTRAGHNFPTDSPLRQLILLVKAEDRVRTELIQVGGDRIPNWGGPGPISPLGMAETLDGFGIKDYSGQPGRIFANLLVEEETNLSPGIAYWNETKAASVNSVNGGTSDTRLRPFVPDTSIYSFAMPDAGDVRITIQLVYRFAFYDLMVWKEWFDRPDIIVAKVVCDGPPTRPDELLHSCVRVDP